jgi:3-oxoacyl-[acyl-carrier protein] reductase
MTQRRAIVTGGSSGIGAATCRELIAAGFEVINVSRRTLEPALPGLRSVAADLADAGSARAVFDELAREAPASTLIHCAGAILQRPAAEVTQEDLQQLMQLHVGCAIQMFQANLKAMQAERFGRVLLVSSRAALGMVNRTVYSATKSALLGLARTWALEFAAAGITTNVVSPGPIAATEMFERQVPQGSELRSNPGKMIPVGRLGEPADVARAIMFVSDPAASFITGQILYVCGGSSVGGLTL